MYDVFSRLLHRIPLPPGLEICIMPCVNGFSLRGMDAGERLDSQEEEEKEGVFEQEKLDKFRAGAVVYVSGEENNSQVAARAAR